jgi:hypothetical protein
VDRKWALLSHPWTLRLHALTPSAKRGVKEVSQSPVECIIALPALRIYIGAAVALPTSPFTSTSIV